MDQHQLQEPLHLASAGDAAALIQVVTAAPRWLHVSQNCSQMALSEPREPNSVQVSPGQPSAGHHYGSALLSKKKNKNHILVTLQLLNYMAWNIKYMTYKIYQAYNYINHIGDEILCRLIKEERLFKIYNII